MIPWLPNFQELSFGQQTSLAGNGQSLPVFGTIITLGLFQVELVEGGVACFH